MNSAAESAAAAAFESLGALSPDVRVSRESDGRSLEAIVQDMMRPLLKEWLEDNLPEIVEEVVEREVRRISERRMRRRRSA
jgi:cell pole-organizing protein PopZ